MSGPALRYLPEHWTWHGDPITPGRAAVVDIDGVLSDAVGRQHYIEAPRRDWRSFFDACGEDPVIEEVKTLLDLLDPELQIVLLTARPHRVHHLTEAWLRRYEIRWDLLIMRPWGDYEVARDFKQSRSGSCERPDSSWPWPSRTTAGTSRCSGREGIPCLYVHSGYYD